MDVWVCSCGRGIMSGCSCVYVWATAKPWVSFTLFLRKSHWAQHVDLASCWQDFPGSACLAGVCHCTQLFAWVLRLEPRFVLACEQFYQTSWFCFRPSVHWIPEEIVTSLSSTTALFVGLSSFTARDRSSVSRSRENGVSKQVLTWADYWCRLCSSHFLGFSVWEDRHGHTAPHLRTEHRLQCQPLTAPVSKSPLLPKTHLLKLLWKAPQRRKCCFGET